MNITHAIHRIFQKHPVVIDQEPLVNDGGVSNRVASSQAGIISCHVKFADGSEWDFVAKRKTVLIIANGIKLLSRGKPLLFFRLAVTHKILGYNKSCMREAILYSSFDKELAPYLPAFIGAYTEPFTGSCLVALEHFSQRIPQITELHRLIEVITEFHARYYNNEAEAKRLMLNRYTFGDYKGMRYNLKHMMRRLYEDDLKIFGADKLAVIECFIRCIHAEYASVSFHRTLTHNDYSIRNISADGDDIIVYDWELAAYQNPEHDIIELLISVLHGLSDDDARLALSYHRTLLSEKTGVVLSDEQYRGILRFNLLELCVNKLCMLRLAGKTLSLDFTEQLAVNASRMMDILDIT